MIIRYFSNFSMRCTATSILPLMCVDFLHWLISLSNGICIWLERHLSPLNTREVRFGFSNSKSWTYLLGPRYQALLKLSNSVHQEDDLALDEIRAQSQEHPAQSKNLKQQRLQLRACSLEGELYLPVQQSCCLADKLRHILQMYKFGHASLVGTLRQAHGGRSSGHFVSIFFARKAHSRHALGIGEQQNFSRDCGLPNRASVGKKEGFGV